MILLWFLPAPGIAALQMRTGLQLGMLNIYRNTLVLFRADPIIQSRKTILPYWTVGCRVVQPYDSLALTSVRFSGHEVECTRSSYCTCALGIALRSTLQVYV